jgi:hypothetical protein
MNVKELYVPDDGHSRLKHVVTIGITTFLDFLHRPVFYILEQQFSTWGTHTPWGYTLRAQKSLNLVTKSLSWLITQ